jgi:hypothetical protein
VLTVAYGDRTTYKACGSEIIQLGGGHRQREYCDDNCRQAAFRVRREQERRDIMRERWGVFTLETQGYLVWLMSRSGEDLTSGIAVQLAREVEDQLRNRFQPEHPQNAQACLEKLAQAGRHIEKLESQVEIQRHRLGQ